MATQLKASDYQHIIVPAKPAQHIRIAFVDPNAQRAVSAAVSKLPPALQQATLDDLATASLRSLLVRRNDLTDLLNRSHDWTTEQDDEALSVINRLEMTLLKRRADSTDDAVMKLIAVAQVGAEGNEVDELEAARAIADARRHFGVGYVHDGLREEAKYVADVDQKAADVAQRAAEWHRLYRARMISLEAFRSYERDIYIPADPEMDDPIHLEYDRLVSEEFLAVMRLLKAPVPGASELAFKLTLLEAEGWMYHQFEEVREQISADARVVAGHGGVVGLDAPLLSAYADCRRGMCDLISAASDQTSAAAQDRIDVGEAFLVDNQADSIEGVIAKLRVAFRSLVGESWSDEAVIDPTTPAFRHGLLLADMYQQLLWRGIEDLARIAGVSLSEQGA